MTTAARPAVTITGLRKRYGNRDVLDGVDLTVDRGEIFALLGPNGAGKTTLVETIEGYRAADAGDVRVLGVDPARGGPAWRARIGLMLQEGGVHPRVTPHEALRLYAALHLAPRGVDELLDLVGLRAVAGTPYRRLSGGERQRLGLALALVGRPELLVLDEPTAGMDPEARTAARALIRQLRDEGATILLTTHDLADVQRVADRVAVLRTGRVIAVDTPARLTAGSRMLRVRLAPPAGADGLEVALRTIWPATRVAAVDDALGITGAPVEPALVEAVARWAAARGQLIVELNAATPLEDRYLDLVRGDVRT